MNRTDYLFCTKQFKPIIALVVIIAVVVVGWTAFRGGERR